MLLWFAATGQALSADTVPVLTIDPTLSIQSLSGHVLGLRDANGRLTIGDVALADTAGDLRWTSDEYSLRYTADAFWLRVDISDQGRVTSRGDYSLVLVPTYIDWVDVYIPRVAKPRSEADFEHVQRGDHVPLGDNAGGGLFFSMPLVLPGPGATPIYIRLKTSGTLVLHGWISSRAGVSQSLIERTVTTTVLLTLTATACLFSLLQWLFARRRRFLSFALMFFSDGFYVAATSGIMLPVLQHLPADYIDRIVSLSVLLLVAANADFVRHQIETRRYFPMFNHLAGWVIGVVLCCMIATALGYYQTIAMPTVMIGFGIIALFVYASARMPPQGRKPGWLAIHLVGWVKLFSAAISIFWLFGGMPTGALIGHYYWVAIALEIPFMAVALLQRVQYVDRRRQDRESLRIARKSEKQARTLVKQRTSELQQAKDAAERALAAERDARLEQLRFVDVVRHQYQTPLAVIRTSVATLEKSQTGSTSGNLERLQRIKTAVSTLVQVMDVSLHRSRLKGAAAKADLSDVPLAKLAREVVNKVKMLYATRDIRLEFEGVEAATVVRLDPDMIAIALTNLLENALKFSNDDDPVRVRCSKSENRLIIRVIDRGIGIPSTDVDKIGDRYFRASNAGSVPGTGLGVNIVRTIAEAHGGAFRIGNNDEGGVTAEVSLPLNPREVSRVSTEARTAASADEIGPTS